ncbi:MAG: hypothetical protein B7Z66_12630 [Chromatiales bacterium 21-64-14]|nr:MAG: hypothetical protein B7Z66_12630 [Chromatiales bacterium 21-64-14]
MLYRDLRDQVFFVAPGEWDLWRCSGCGSAYLDPRPDRQSIGLAYGSYFTHEAPAGHKTFNARRINPIVRLRQALRNDYLNRRFGYALTPALGVGTLLARWFPARGLKEAHRIRHLPAPGRHPATLLDVGCGNGGFLLNARQLGYEVAGLEFDPKAVQVARGAGLDVTAARIPGSGLDTARFDQVTLSHVIEHLHDPVGALQEIHCLLKPGGRVWIKTPNLDATGRRRFGAAWRGLEPPRHLVLFGPQGLFRVLAKAGFSRAELLLPEPEARFYLLSSSAIARGTNPHSRCPISPRLAWDARRLDREAARHPEQGESITMVAWKDR